MIKKRNSQTWKNVLIVGLIGILLTACSATSLAIQPTTQPSQMQTTMHTAQVQSVEIQILDTNPTQVNAVVHGNLTEACAVLGESRVVYTANVFHITVYAISPSDRGCLQVTTPFETTVALNMLNLPAGTYSVTANGVNAVFVLPLPAQTATQPIPTVAPTVVAPTAVAPTAVTSSSNTPVAPTAVAPTAVTSSSNTCEDAAEFVADVTIPDNSVLDPNIPFTKTWRVKNIGSCTWDSNYLVAYISGATMTQQPGYWLLQPGQSVQPGQTMDISVGMTSPIDNGKYQSFWGLMKENGQLMPVQGGANGNSFYVKIKVKDSSISTGKITDASIGIELEQGSGTACTANSSYFVHATITADGPTTASYEIGSTAGQISAGYFDEENGLLPYISDTLTFDQAATKTINLRFVGPYPYPTDITVNLRVNGGEWHNTKLSCP